MCGDKLISYKRGTTPTLPVTVDVDISTVSKIEFIFKQQNSESSTKLVLKTYPTDVEYDSTIIHINHIEIVEQYIG